MLYKTIFTWLTGTRYGGSGGTEEVVSNRLIHVHTHLTHRTVVTPWKKNMDVMISIIHQNLNQSHCKTELNTIRDFSMLFTYMELHGLPIFGGGPISRPGARSPRSGPESSITGSTGLIITGPELSGMIGLVSIGG